MNYGEIKQVGIHRVMCGDASNAEHVAMLMSGSKARLVVTEPPYNVGYKGKTKIREEIANDKQSDAIFAAFIDKAISNMASAVEPGTQFYVFMANSSLCCLWDVMKRNGLRWSNTIIWAKDSFVLSWGDYHQCYEPIWYGWKKGAPRLYPLKDRKQSNLWQFKRPKKSPLHPTQKPVEVIKRIISNSSQEGDIVLDLFGGSGTTAVAANELGRACYIMEIDPAYCDIIIDRLQVEDTTNN